MIEFAVLDYLVIEEHTWIQIGTFLELDDLLDHGSVDSGRMNKSRKEVASRRRSTHPACRPVATPVKTIRFNDGAQAECDARRQQVCQDSRISSKQSIMAVLQMQGHTLFSTDNRNCNAFS